MCDNLILEEEESVRLRGASLYTLSEAYLVSYLPYGAIWFYMVKSVPYVAIWLELIPYGRMWCVSNVGYNP
jgi:hypothetical protein